MPIQPPVVAAPYMQPGSFARSLNASLQGAAQWQSQKRVQGALQQAGGNFTDAADILAQQGFGQEAQGLRQQGLDFQKQMREEMVKRLDHQKNALEVAYDRIRGESDPNKARSIMHATLRSVGVNPESVPGADSPANLMRGYLNDVEFAKDIAGSVEKWKEAGLRRLKEDPNTTREDLAQYLQAGQQLHGLRNRDVAAQMQTLAALPEGPLTAASLQPVRAAFGELPTKPLTMEEHRAAAFQESGQPYMQFVESEAAARRAPERPTAVPGAAAARLLHSRPDLAPVLGQGAIGEAVAGAGSLGLDITPGLEAAMAARTEGGRSPLERLGAAYTDEFGRNVASGLVTPESYVSENRPVLRALGMGNTVSAMDTLYGGGALPAVPPREEAAPTPQSPGFFARLMGVEPVAAAPTATPPAAPAAAPPADARSMFAAGPAGTGGGGDAAAQLASLFGDEPLAAADNNAVWADLSDTRKAVLREVGEVSNAFMQAVQRGDHDAAARAIEESTGDSALARRWREG